MGFFGTLLYLGTAAWMIFFGYTLSFNLAVLLVSPLGFMFGYMIRKSSASSRIFGGDGSNTLFSVIKTYINCVVAVAIFYGIGYGINFLMDYQPPPGAGSI